MRVFVVCNFSGESKEFDFLIGTDEAGRGPAAGGVWAGAVCFKKDVDETLFEKLNDFIDEVYHLKHEIYKGK